MGEFSGVEIVAWHFDEDDADADTERLRATQLAERGHSATQSGHEPRARRAYVRVRLDAPTIIWSEISVQVGRSLPHA